MKKSEFVNFLAEELFYRDQANEHNFWYREEDRPLLENEKSKDRYYGDAKILLEHIERRGMKPPALTPEENYVGLHCEWEPE
jgi:hypothetical protein